ncbi:MAG: cell division protein FtsA [Legionellales bacterium]|nr:cell division protein FtsA [Legionellales bacterium]
MKKSDPGLIAALDIGTTKVVCLIGRVLDSDAQAVLEIVGIGSHPASGMKRGVVVNIESTVRAISEAIKSAEQAASTTIRAAYAGIAGSHIRSMNSHGIVAIRQQEVSHADIDRVIEAARAVAIPADQQILHVLPQEFFVDNQDGIRDPIGMSGVRLEAKTHIVTGSVSAAQNIIKCVERSGVQVNDVILEQLASSQAVLTEDEKELGVCLVDIGGGTTDIAVFVDGAIRHSAVIPIAGNQVTNDLAVALRISTADAEAIKLTQSSVSLNGADANTVMEVSGIADEHTQAVSLQTIADVVRARYEELFQMIELELRRSGLHEALAAGIVFTGGGSKVAQGMSLAESIFNMPVRIAAPQSLLGIDEDIRRPEYATAVGLMLYGHQQMKQGITVCDGMNERIWMRRLKQWLHCYF